MEYLRVTNLSKEPALVHHWGDATLGDDAGLHHFLHGKLLVVLAFLHTPYLAESTPTDYIEEFEVVSSVSYTKNSMKKG